MGKRTRVLLLYYAKSIMSKTWKRPKKLTGQSFTGMQTASLSPSHPPFCTSLQTLLNNLLFKLHNVPHLLTGLKWFTLQAHYKFTLWLLDIHNIHIHNLLFQCYGEELNSCLFFCWHIICVLK